MVIYSSNAANMWQFVYVYIYIYIFILKPENNWDSMSKQHENLDVINMENQPKEIEDFTKRSCIFSCGSSQANMMISRLEVPELISQV